MKIIFTQDALVNAGAERSHLEILSRFSKEVDVGFVYFYPKHDLREAYERAGIRLFFLDIPESYHFSLALSRLVRLIRKEKPDLLISSLWRADIITRIASVLTGVPLIGTLVNDSYSPIAWTDKKGLKYKVVYWLDRFTAGIPIHWIANANALADSHVKTLGLKRDEISVVYRGRTVIASDAGAKQSLNDYELSPEKTASASNSQEIKLGIQEGSLAVTEDVKASDGGAASPELDSGKQSFKEEEQEKDRFVPRDDDGHVIASDEGVKQSSPEETASSVEGTEFRHGVSENRLAVTRNFISYGRLLERKGFQDAIQAFSQVLKTYPDCTLTIFGEGQYRVELERQIQYFGLEGAVFLPGKIQNPVYAMVNGYCLSGQSKQQSPQTFHCQSSTANRPLPTEDCQLKTAHCFLFPSWYEGFSGALVEGMMAGIPIIASDIPMNLEAVVDQKTALVFQVGNSDDLAEKMRFAIEHPEQMAALGQAARKEAEERFDIEKIASEYEGVVRNISSNSASLKKFGFTKER